MAQHSLSAGNHLAVLSVRQWWYLAGILFVVLPLLLSIVFDRQIYRWYLQTEVVPKLETQLGFSSGNIPVGSSSGLSNRHMFGITRVTPAGAFASSGFRAGDIPVGYVHGFMEGFVDDIRTAVEEKRVAEISVINCANAQPPEDCPRRTVVFKPLR